jgi:hypothetical protein
MSHSRKEKIHALLNECAAELLEFVKDRETQHQDRWVPATEIKALLQLNFVSYPQAAAQQGEKGWLFAILARILEDAGRLEYQKQGSRSFCRSIN